MSKHSPTPWTGAPVSGVYWLTYGITSGDKFVAYVQRQSDADSNAARIVHCVNLHDGLVAAIKTAKEILFAEARCGSSAASDASVILADALAKAGEE